MIWDDRYSEAELAYGDQPNDFLVEQITALTPGTCLCLAEGQGRNAVWLAQQNFAVTAMDQSPVGLDRAQKLAEERGVAIQTEVGDLTSYDLGEGRWDTIVSIWVHLPLALRRSVHQRVAKALRPGGTFLLEAYTPRHLDMPGVGGPADVSLLMTEDALRGELEGLDLVIAREKDRQINEGQYHDGLSAVVQILAKKPKGE